MYNVYSSTLLSDMFVYNEIFIKHMLEKKRIERQHDSRHHLHKDWENWSESEYDSDSV